MHDTKYTEALLNQVRDQYERFPYPPVWPLAIPRLTQGQGLRFENAAGGFVVQGATSSGHEGIRILVAGAGTLEPLVVAQMHPHAKEIVAVDCSNTSVERLNTRLALAGLRGYLLRSLRRRHHHLPRIRVVRADLLTWEDGRFDYIVATNVLHHLPEPPKMLARLAGWLAPGGLLRLVTYAHQSRYWVRQTAQWLALSGVHVDTPGLRRACHRAVARLPIGHPVRSSFRASSERAHPASLVDAYFHACDNPLTPLEWKRACDACGLRLIGEGQHPCSRSEVLDQLIPEMKSLGVWEKLQVLDDVLELASNPVLWLRKETALANESGLPTTPTRLMGMSVPAAGKNVLALDHPAALVLNEPYLLPSQTYFDLRQGVDRAKSLLDTVGIHVEHVIKAMGTEFGPRWTRDQKEVLHGLTLSEYDYFALQGALQPWGDAQWSEQAGRFGTAVRVVAGNGLVAQHGNLCDQARWLQMVLGPTMAFIPIRITR